MRNLAILFFVLVLSLSLVSSVFAQSDDDDQDKDDDDFDEFDDDDSGNEKADDDDDEEEEEEEEDHSMAGDNLSRTNSKSEDVGGCGW